MWHLHTDILKLGEKKKQHRKITSSFSIIKYIVLQGVLEIFIKSFIFSICTIYVVCDKSRQSSDIEVLNYIQPQNWRKVHNNSWPFMWISFSSLALKWISFSSKARCHSKCNLWHPHNNVCAAPSLHVFIICEFSI